MHRLNQNYSNSSHLSTPVFSGSGKDKGLTANGAWPLLQQFSSSQPQVKSSTKKLVSCGFEEPYQIVHVDDPTFSVDKLSQPWRLLRATPKYWRKMHEEREGAEIARLEALAKKGDDLTVEQRLLLEHGGWREALHAASTFARSEANRDRGPRADMSKVAPTSNQAKKKQKRRQMRSKTYIMGEEDELEKRRNDKDRYQWVLMDADETIDRTWIGTVDAELDSTYVLFVENDNGYTVCPVEKRYRFLPKPANSNVASERAMDLMKKKLAQFGKDPADLLAASGRFKERAAISESQQRASGGAEAVESEKTRALVDEAGYDEFNDDGSGRNQRNEADLDENALDYDEAEMFADDEEEVIGIEDSDMIDHIQKKRKYESKLANLNFVEGADLADDGKALHPDADDDFDATDYEKLKAEQKERRLLAKSESNGAYIINSDDENPYLSSSDADNDDQSEYSGDEGSRSEVNNSSAKVSDFE